MGADIESEVVAQRRYSLEGLLAEGIPRVRVREDALAALAAPPAGEKPLYLAGRQEEGYDLITRMVEAPERCAEGEMVMGRVAFGTRSSQGQATPGAMPLERLLSHYENMSDAPAEIVVADKEEGTGYLMLGDGIALKGPLSELQECRRAASRFRLRYGYAAAYDTESGVFSLGIACTSAHSGKEASVERHPWDAVVGSACGGGRAGRQEEKDAAQEERVRTRGAGGGYLAMMEAYRSTLRERCLSMGERGLLETLVDALTGRALRGGDSGKRAWRWQERVRLLEELLAESAGAGSDGENCAEAVAELERIAAGHRYLRSRHPGLMRKVRALLRGGAA